MQISAALQKMAEQHPTEIKLLDMKLTVGGDLHVQLRFNDTDVSIRQLASQKNGFSHAYVEIPITELACDCDRFIYNTLLNCNGIMFDIAATGDTLVIRKQLRHWDEPGNLFDVMQTGHQQATLATIMIKEMIKLEKPVHLH